MYVGVQRFIDGQEEFGLWELEQCAFYASALGDQRIQTKKSGGWQRTQLDHNFLHHRASEVLQELDGVH